MECRNQFAAGAIVEGDANELTSTFSAWNQEISSMDLVDPERTNYWL